MKIDKTVNGDQIIINVEGHLDTNTSPQLESVLNEILDVYFKMYKSIFVF